MPLLPSNSIFDVNSQAMHILTLFLLFQVYQKSPTLYHTPGDGVLVPRDRKLLPDAEQLSQLQRSRPEVAKSRRGVWERTTTAPSMRPSGVGRR